jgi:hypothetical protein
VGFYVSLNGVDDDTLSFCGYVKIAEDDDHVIYRHFGDDVIVIKSDPFLIVDDINDAALLGSDIIPMPPDC